MNKIAKIFNYILGKKYRVLYTGIDKPEYNLKEALEAGVTPEEFFKNRHVHGIVHESDDYNKIREVMVISTISGGANYEHNMPKYVGLQRFMSDGTNHKMLYIQSHDSSNIIISHSRRSGNTTRQIDVAIQRLFAGDTVKVMDHFKNGGHKKLNKSLLNRILKRLYSEHNGKNLLAEGYLKIDFDSNSLSFSKQYLEVIK